jgi:hypothetical protein
MTLDDVRKSHRLQAAELRAEYPEQVFAEALFAAACDTAEGALRDWLPGGAR